MSLFPKSNRAFDHTATSCFQWSHSNFSLSLTVCSSLLTSGYTLWRLKVTGLLQWLHSCSFHPPQGYKTFRFSITETSASIFKLYGSNSSSILGTGHFSLTVHVTRRRYSTHEHHVTSVCITITWTGLHSPYVLYFHILSELYRNHAQNFFKWPLVTSLLYSRENLQIHDLNTVTWIFHHKLPLNISAHHNIHFFIQLRRRILHLNGPLTFGIGVYSTIHHSTHFCTL